MTEPSATFKLLIMSKQWSEGDSEVSFVTRSVAGAVSRIGTVDVCVPMTAGACQPDGAFTLQGIGMGSDGGWPLPQDATWPSPLSSYTHVIVDKLDKSTEQLLQPAKDQAIHVISDSKAEGYSLPATPISFLPTEDNSSAT